MRAGEKIKQGWHKDGVVIWTWKEDKLGKETKKTSLRRGS